MKILVFNGSPKREKSDTLHITRAFLDGMNDVHQNDVEFINVIDKRIGYCKGCFVCKQNGGICDIDDDMPQILNGILESDMLIFSFPLYCYSFPAPLKALLDRTMPLSTLAMLKDGDHYCHPTTHDFSKTRFVMICGCGFPDAKHNFEAITLQFHRMFPNNALTVTVPESPMFNAQEAAPVTGPFLEIVRAAGREYASTDMLSPRHARQALFAHDSRRAVCAHMQRPAVIITKCVLSIKTAEGSSRSAVY